jgi:hypothetical protein
MGQAFGCIKASTGEVLYGSGNFSAERIEVGVYKVTLQDAGPTPPVVVIAFANSYLTSYGIDESVGGFQVGIHRVCSPGPGTERTDIDFRFVAFWP